MNKVVLSCLDTLESNIYYFVIIDVIDYSQHPYNRLGLQEP